MNCWEKLKNNEKDEKSIETLKEETKHELSEAALLAARMLRDDLTVEDPKYRIQAANSILSKAGFGDVKPEKTENTSPQININLSGVVENLKSLVKGEEKNVTETQGIQHKLHSGEKLISNNLEGINKE